LTETAGGDLIPSGDAGPEGLLIHREQIGLLHDAIAELPERLRTVIEAYFYGNQRMADIAADLGVTESRVSQLRTEALAMLRDGLNGQHAAAGAATAIPVQRRSAVSALAASPSAAKADDRSSKRPSRREAARQAYIAAIASRSTLAGRLAATTTLGDARSVTLESLRTAQ
jgi:RNA polymerase sigma factor for flagellar operon FliA